MRLQSFLSKSGVTSRRFAAELIKRGKVRVNGEVTFEKGLNINPESDEVTYQNKKVLLKEPNIYLVLNKPPGVISTSSDTHGRKTPLDFIPKKYGRLFIVGRLDKDTTGLVLLTNNGEVANRLIHPRFEVPKLYELTINSALSTENREKLQNGITLDGKMTIPVKIEVFRSTPTGSKLQLEMREGRKHQIKAMFGAFDIKVLALKRIAMANIKLGNIKEGEYRILSEPEIKNLQKYLKLVNN